MAFSKSIPCALGFFTILVAATHAASFCGTGYTVHSFSAKFYCSENECDFGQSTFRIALPLRNREFGDQLLRAISDPDSHHYGKWLNQENTMILFAPIVPPNDVLDWMEGVAPKGIVCACDSPACWSLECTSLVDENLRDTYLSSLNDAYHPYGFSTSQANRTRAKFEAKVHAGQYYLTPQTLWNLYSVNYSLHEPVGVGPTEFQNDSSFLPSDLQAFARATGVPARGPTKNHIVGPFSDNCADIEASLDMDYVAGVAPSVQMWYWTSTGWVLSTVEDMLDHEALPSVMTWSWGWSENDQGTIVGTNDSHAYVRHGNDRLMVLALRGVTVVVSSGDAGSPGRTNEDCSNPSALNAVFPGGSPYVLSAGATSLYNVTHWHANDTDAPPLCKNNTCVNGGVEGMCYNGGPGGCFWTAGGGFSNVSARPYYQDRAVSAYLLDSSVSKPFGHFNISGRGYPDLAANGHNYYVVANGAPMAVDGTSASAPTIGALIARLNALRVAHHQPVLGFANPALYAAAAVCEDCFTSPIPGWNNCTESTCCPYGFQGSKSGWDANTGLGTPNFTALARHLI
jgi:subtilase family serine protease